MVSSGNKSGCNLLNSAPQLSPLTHHVFDVCLLQCFPDLCVRVLAPWVQVWPEQRKNRNMSYQSVFPGLGTYLSELKLWCKQYLTVPRKRTGSWGMTDSLLLKASRPMWAMLTPSMMMDPPLSSTSLKSATPSEDLPEETRGQRLYVFTSRLIRKYSTKIWCSTEISNKYLTSTK